MHAPAQTINIKRTITARAPLFTLPSNVSIRRLLARRELVSSAARMLTSLTVHALEV